MKTRNSTLIAFAKSVRLRCLNSHSICWSRGSVTFITQSLGISLSRGFPFFLPPLVLLTRDAELEDAPIDMPCPLGRVEATATSEGNWLAYSTRCSFV